MMNSTLGWLMERWEKAAGSAKGVVRSGMNAAASLIVSCAAKSGAVKGYIMHTEHWRDGNLLWACDTSLGYVAEPFIRQIGVILLITGALIGALIGSLATSGIFLFGIVVNEGLNDVLDKYFKGSTYTAAWYCGLVDNAGWTAYAADDTAVKIIEIANPPTTNGWQEATEYDEATREVITFGAVASQSVDNSAVKAEFTMNASLTIRGAFVVSVSTKGGTTGVLHTEADFTGGSRAVVDNDVLRVTVTETAASA